LLTARNGPAELENLPARLASRLAGGLVVGLELLGPKSRRRFLAKRAAARGLTIRPDALSWLARHTLGSGRQLLAALERLRALTAKTGSPPDAALVRAEFGAEGAAGRPTAERITQQVGRLF